MAESAKIKWREIDVETARRLIRRFNAKIDYQKKAHPEIAETLPQKISIRAFKAQTQTRQMYNRELSMIEDFLKKGAERKTKKVGDLTVSVWELKYTKYLMNELNKQRRKYAEMEEQKKRYVNGKEIKSPAEAAKETENKARELPKKVEGTENWRRFVKNLEKELKRSSDKERANNLRDNLKQAWHKHYTAKDAQKLSSLIDKLPSALLLQLYYEGHEELNVDFHYYDPLDDNEKVRRTVRFLSKYINKKDPSDHVKKLIAAIRKRFKGWNISALIGYITAASPADILQAYYDGDDEADPDYYKTSTLSTVDILQDAEDYFRNF